MSTIRTTSTVGLPEARILENDRIGKVVQIHPIGEIGNMFEIGFDGQLHTECYWDSEVETHIPADEGTLAAFTVKETAGCTCDTCQEIRRQRGIQPLHTLASLLSADAIYCDAPSIIFDVHTQYQDIPVEYRKIVEAQGGLGCMGTGQVGTHCRSCHWVRTA